MKILIINTQNKIATKEMISRYIIEMGLQYVEIEDDILTDDFLFKIEEKIEEKDIVTRDFLLKKKEFHFVSTDKTLQKEQDNFQSKKLYLKKQSKFVNEKLKMNQNDNNRRRYK